MEGWTRKQLIFDHNRNSNYKLKGEHIAISCEKCHVTTDKEKIVSQVKLINIGSKCIDCHKDIHNGQMNHTCEICHNENGWKGRYLLFDHNQHSSSNLDTLHARVSCNLCHLPDKDKIIRYSPLPQQCDTCHTDIVDYMHGKLPDGNADADPHAGRVTCVDCHTTDVARQLPYQYAERCADCHNPRYYGLYFDWQIFIAHSLKSSLQLVKSLGENEDGQKERIMAKIKIAEKIGFHNIQLSKRLLEGNNPLPSR